MSLASPQNNLEPTKVASTAETTAWRHDAYETFRRTKVFSALNGIRCACAIGVIQIHCGWGSRRWQLFNHGELGVDMFFVISGFLIVTLLLRERERTGDISLKKFYARRTLRIFPVYYAMILTILLAFLVVAPWKPNGLKFYLPTAAVLLTYTTDIIKVGSLGVFFHCWSLAMEEQFYLAWPAMEKVLSAPAKWGLLALVLLFNQMINFGFFRDVIVRIYGYENAWRMPIFLVTFTPIILGVVLAHLLHHRRSFEVMYRIVGYRWSPFLFLAVVVGIVSTTSVYQGLSRLSLHLFLMLGLGSVVIREDHWMKRILTLAPIERLGIISYGMYLYHVAILDLMTRVSHGAWSPPLMFVAVTASTIAVASLSYRFIESRFLAMRQLFSVSDSAPLRAAPEAKGY